jgi:hypothetical protein
MEAIIENVAMKSVRLTELQFEKLTGELVPADPDTVIREVKNMLDRGRSEDLHGKKLECLEQANKRLNTVMTVYHIRQAFEEPMPIPDAPEGQVNLNPIKGY